MNVKLLDRHDHAVAPLAETLWLRGVIALACLAICGVIIGAGRHGGTMDEYATFYFADPAIPLATAWTHLWTTETNPPFFYFFARLWLHITGPTLFDRRLINLLPLIFLLAWFLYAARRYPAYRPFLAGFALFAFSGKFFLWHFPEYRSYFSQYCAGLVFLGAASIGYLERERRPDLFQLAALPVLITFHQVTALYTGVLLVPLVLTDLRRGFYLRAVCLITVTFLALIPLGLFTWLQARQMNHVLHAVAWITPRGPLNACATMISHIIPALGENWVAFGIAGFAVFQPLHRPAGAVAALIRLIGGAAFMATCLALVINSHSPLIVDRYFSFFTVEIMVILAFTIVPVLVARPKLAALVIANAAVYVIFSVMAVARPSGLDKDASIVAKLVAQCPATRIHAGSMPAYRAEQLGLADVAATYHLTLLPLTPDTPGVCPIIYWTEYRMPSKQQIAAYNGDVVSAANASAGFGLSAAMRAQTTVIKSKTGIILVVRAATK